jgi:hypothetical protein
MISHESGAFTLACVGYTADLRQTTAVTAGTRGDLLVGKSVDFTGRIAGAGDEDRTRDVQLGKLAFYR